MHKKYIEITLLPDVEVELHYLVNNAIAKIHLALSEVASNNKGIVPIGCSFPAYSAEHCTLGNKIRLFGYTEEELLELKIQNLFSDMMDYAHITSVKSVPDNVAFATYGAAKSRKATEAYKAKLARRRVKRSEAQGQPVSFEEAIKLYENIDREKHLPYSIQVSNNTGNRFPLVIQKRTALSGQSGRYNQFGLSNQSTVPDF